MGYGKTRLRNTNNLMAAKIDRAQIINPVGKGSAFE